MAASTHPGSEAARAQRGREETTQIALETVAEGGPLAGVLVAADPRCVKFQEFVEPLGIRSAWCTPIFPNEGKVLGTFAHYNIGKFSFPRIDRRKGLVR